MTYVLIVVSVWLPDQFSEEGEDGTRLTSPRKLSGDSIPGKTSEMTLKMTFQVL